MIKASALWLLLILPLISCVESHNPAASKSFVFAGSEGRKLTATLMGSALGHRSVVFETQTIWGPIKQEIHVTEDDGGIAFWASWDQQGKQWHIMSCGSGVAETIQSIAAGRDSANGAAAKTLINESMQRWFGPRANLDTWFCDGPGHQKFLEQVNQSKELLVVPFNAGSAGSR
jgi:hypothetical protein